MIREGPRAGWNADDEQVAGWMADMQRHVESAPAVYRPGAFWADLIERNLAMLRLDGVGNLKRTVGNNYYTWLVLALPDPQMRRAVRAWLRHPSPAPLRAWMEPDVVLRSMDRDEPFPLEPKAARRYRFFVAATWDHARREDRLGLGLRLEEPEVGNPIRVRHRGRLVSQDLANSIVECNYAARSGLVRDGARIAELGAGYGRLAHVFAEAARVTYCVFDIPPALALSQWYLGEVLGHDRIVPFRPEVDAEHIAGLRPGTVAFFTPDQLERFPDGWFDLAQSISTLPEMPERQAARYVSLLAAKASGEVFLKQWQRWRNEADDAELAEDWYVLPAPWQLVARRTDPVQPLFFNRRWARGPRPGA